MLSQQEELELIRRARWGGQSARDLLWVLFYGFAVAEARRLALQKGADRDEAKGEAALAIPEAISLFNLRRKVRSAPIGPRWETPSTTGSRCRTRIYPGSR